MIQQPLYPATWFDVISLGTANSLLEEWGHRMGPLRRPINGDTAHALVHRGSPVAVTIASTLIRANVGGGLAHLTRETTVELSRLCASRPGLCRVALRLWREMALPELPFSAAISYQDADLHNGDTYRFDSWRRAGYSHSGTDSRSGRRGRNKWIWPPGAAEVPV